MTIHCKLSKGRCINQLCKKFSYSEPCEDGVKTIEKVYCHLERHKVCAPSACFHKDSENCLIKNNGVDMAKVERCETSNNSLFWRDNKQTVLFAERN
ncbi:MAG TPA: hypothetical protein ENH82_13205 [bacterium]|nr:hypothetical protein [bacterium]